MNLNVYTYNKDFKELFLSIKTNFSPTNVSFNSESVATRTRMFVFKRLCKMFANKC